MDTSIIQKEINPLVSRADEYVVSNAKDMEDGAEFLSVLNKKNDSIQAEKTKITAPLLQALKEERGRWKPLETALSEAIRIVSKKMSAYQTEQKSIAQKASEKIASRVGQGRGHLKFETASKKIEEIEIPANKVTVDSGKVFFKTVEKCEVEDKTKIPLEYLVPDMIAIRREMRNGNHIKGVRYWNEEQVNNRR